MNPDLAADLLRLRQHHEFTRDRIGQPGCAVRVQAAEFVATIDAAIAALRPPPEPPRGLQCRSVGWHIANLSGDD